MHHLLQTSTSAEEQHRNADVAVLPIGSFEQHGTYLPLSTDTVIAVTISGELAAEYPVMQLPPITLPAPTSTAPGQGPPASPPPRCSRWSTV